MGRVLEITPDEIAALLPGSRVLEVPSTWFKNVKDTPNAFEQFYQYLISLGCENDRDLHNRARVGHRLQRRLIQSERNRLSRTRRLTGEKLNRALSWIDIGSGPQEMFAERRIVGDAVCVLPKYSEKEGEVQSRLIREQIEADAQHARRCRSKMSGSSFYLWVIGAREQQDRIGDIARDIAGDERFPRDAKTYAEVASYLDHVGASYAAVECAEDAWLEYAERYPERIVSSAWCDACHGKIDSNDGAIVFGSGYEILHDACVDRGGEEDAERLPLAKLYEGGLAAFHEFAEMHQGFWSDDIEKKLRLWGFRYRGPTKKQVYFVQVGDSGPIKIGYTATSVEKRIASLQTACPEPLRLLAVLDGGREIEGDLHARFARYRKSGEWFEPHPDIIAFLVPIAKR